MNFQMCIKDSVFLPTRGQSEFFSTMKELYVQVKF